MRFVTDAHRLVIPVDLLSPSFPLFLLERELKDTQLVVAESLSIYSMVARRGTLFVGAAVAGTRPHEETVGMVEEESNSFWCSLN